MDNTGKSSEITLLKDSEWERIEGTACRVIQFTPFASIENGKIKNAGLSKPYCAVTIECKDLPSITTGYVTHKIDFQHLWAVFKIRGVKEGEEVLIFWTYGDRHAGMFSAVFPKLVINVCHKNAYEYYPMPDKMSIQEWLNAIHPILELRPSK
ncbi:MAG: hypothetical protein Q7T57_01805 [Dehalococcoidales bacterium]|nr:hypothetical protein [Dehalococcoidales bacterium]